MREKIRTSTKLIAITSQNNRILNIEYGQLDNPTNTPH
jgi:hypothetical protein